MTWIVETVDNVPAGRNSIAVRASKFSPEAVHISYHDTATRTLKYATRTGTAGPWTLESIDADRSLSPAAPTHFRVGEYNSLAVDASGNVHVAYSRLHASRDLNGDARYCRRFSGAVQWDQPLSILPPSPGTPGGSHIKLRLDPLGRPNVMYFRAATVISQSYEDTPEGPPKLLNKPMPIAALRHACLRNGQFHGDMILAFAFFFGGDYGDRRALGSPFAFAFDSQGRMWVAGIGRRMVNGVLPPLVPPFEYSLGPLLVRYDNPADNYHESRFVDQGLLDVPFNSYYSAHYGGVDRMSDLGIAIGDEGVRGIFSRVTFGHTATHTLVTWSNDYPVNYTWGFWRETTGLNMGYFLPGHAALPQGSIAYFEEGVPSVLTAQSVVQIPNLACLSFQLDSARRPHFVYYDLSQFPRAYLKYVHRASDGSWHSEQIDETNAGHYASLALSPYSGAHVSYADAQTGRLKYARRVAP